MGFLLLRPDDLIIVIGIVSWLWFFVGWPVRRIRRRVEASPNCRALERGVSSLSCAGAKVKEPIFQPGAGWTVLTMVLTFAFSWAFTYFVSAPIARVVVDATVRPLLKWVGLL